MGGNYKRGRTLEIKVLTSFNSSKTVAAAFVYLNDQRYLGGCEHDILENSRAGRRRFVLRGGLFCLTSLQRV